MQSLCLELSLKIEILPKPEKYVIAIEEGH